MLLLITTFVSIEQNAQHPTLVTTPHRRCGSWPAILCGGHRETVEMQGETIDDRCVSIKDQSKSTGNVTARVSDFKEYQPGTSPGHCSSSSLQSCSDATFGFSSSPQNIPNTSSKKIPSVSSRSCCCSTIDTKKLSADPCTFCSGHQRFLTELSVDIRHDDETGVSTSNCGRNASIPSCSSSNTSEQFDELGKIPPNASKR